MGASVRVEDAVFGDPRFERLGLLCGLSLADAEAWSIGVMAKIWRQCTSKMSYSLSPSSLNAIARKADFSARLVEAELGDVVPRDDGAIRIRGTEGRIEWLAKLRRSAAGGLARSRNMARGADGSLRGEKMTSGSATAPLEHLGGETQAYAKHVPKQPSSICLANAIAYAKHMGGDHQPDAQAQPSVPMIYSYDQYKEKDLNTMCDVEKRDAPQPGNEARELASYLLDAIRSHTPGFRGGPGQAAAWSSRTARDMDLALRLDARDVEGMMRVIDWAHRDPAGAFWRPNLLSGGKARKHYERIEMLMREKPGPRRRDAGLTAEDIAVQARELEEDGR